MEPKVAAVDVSTLQARVYDSLRLALLRGRFVPGEPVSLLGLAEMVGTSAMPVREAVRRLVTEGALERSSDRVLRVTPVSHAACEELMRLRAHIEGYAAERAARRVNRRLVSELGRINDRMRATAIELDMESALDANYSFHFALYEAADSPPLSDIIAALWLRSGPMLAVARRSPERARAMFLTGVAAHQRIIDAMVDRDVVAVRRGVAVDLRAASIWMMRHPGRLDESAEAARSSSKEGEATTDVLHEEKSLGDDPGFRSSGMRRPSDGRDDPHFA